MSIYNVLQYGLDSKAVGEVLRIADADFSKNIAIGYSRAYSRTFINCFVKYRSIRMALGFACKWFEREFSETLGTAPDFSEYVSKLKLSERDRELLKRTLRMIFILRK